MGKQGVCVGQFSQWLHKIYTGKSVDTPNVDIGLCSKVCLDLLEDLNVYGLHLYTDNYYISPSL